MVDKDQAAQVIAARFEELGYERDQARKDRDDADRRLRQAEAEISAYAEMLRDQIAKWSPPPRPPVVVRADRPGYIDIPPLAV